jgi:hypothetical protein
MFRRIVNLAISILLTFETLFFDFTTEFCHHNVTEAGPAEIKIKNLIEECALLYPDIRQ